MADDTPPQSPPPDGQGKQPEGDKPEGKGDQAPPKVPESKQAPQPKVDDEPDDDKQFSQEQVNKIVQKRIDKAVRRELIKRGIDPDDKDTGKDAKPTVETVTKERDDLAQRLRTLEARDQLETFIADKRNNLQVRNIRGLFKYIKDDLEFDDEGNVTNFKDVLTQAKSEAGEFFGANHGSADGGRGNNQPANVDMNTIIRGR